MKAIMAASSVPSASIGNIVWGVVLLVAFVLGVVFPLLIFITAVWEKQRFETVVPDEPAAEEDQAVVREAVALGFAKWGRYSDGDEGIKKGRFDLLGSPDGRTVLWINRGAVAGRHRLMSRLKDGRWVITSSVMATRDLSGMRYEEMIPSVSLEILWRQHQNRLGRWPELFEVLEQLRFAEVLEQDARQRVAI